MAPIARVLRQIGAGAQSLAVHLSDQPKSVLENTPSLTPPPGIVSNFQHRASRRESVIVVSTLLMALGLICICIRAWAKLVNLLAIAAYTTTILTVTPGGTSGYHQYDIPLSAIFTNRNIIFMFSSQYSLKCSH
ncbi:hypothetical protein BGAL_0168g00070 [Botrytis galanthina]|uniref:Uncharacterized protein n=1 Tax=Botrytis galanthina TaxID=278940 RepID=A0A4S8R1X8_9HELO|nr:hypothetical protein BGAL_0168g00070 [Botrytis galanthina]